VQMLVAMAASEQTVDRRRKMAERVSQGLTLLERLNGEIAMGVVGAERLRELAEWSQRMETPDDPQLAQLARDLDLRVRVELARLDQTI
jgi:hypothetical protein